MSAMEFMCPCQQYDGSAVVRGCPVRANGERHAIATAGNAKKFLNTLIERAPYPVKAIQGDGGSKFMAEFEQACFDKGILLFVLPLRSPKLNGHVERAQRTLTEEFFDFYMGELDLKSVNRALRDLEHFYNRARPHHSFDLMSPAEYLFKHNSGLVPISKLSHMC